MLTNRSEIIDFIPQREPFIAVHEILAVSDESARTQFEILPESIFVSNGLLGEAGLLENIAQTAAAQMGFICREKKLPVPLGYIASIKNWELVSLPMIGQVIETSIHIKNQVLNIILLDGVVTVNEEVMCKCEMRIFIKND